MKWNKKVVIAASALALLLAGGASIKPALAYLTTYTETSGGVKLATRPDSEIEENAEGMDKIIQIRNTGGEDIKVRVKLYYPDGWELGQDENANIIWSNDDSKYAVDDGAENTMSEGSWVEHESEVNCLVYTKSVPVGKLTKPLKLHINPPIGYDKDFNVIVIYEYDPVEEN